MYKLQETFRALKYRNFRLFFPGLMVSATGIWIQNIAINWLVYDTTKSPFIMGVVMFFNAIPLFLVTPFAGVIIDKFHRHKLLLSVQILFCLQALLITALSYFDLIRIWNIILLGIFLNTIAALDAPLRQSTFVFLVDDKKDLGNAISLNSSCFNVARLLGPALGGLLIAYTNITFCFFINFLCLLPIIILVKKMRIEDKKDEKIKNKTIFEGLKEGISYALNDSKITLLLSYIGMYCFLIMIYPMLLPIYTAEILKSQADILGFLLAMAGIGSLISSLSLASIRTMKNLRKILLAGAVSASFAFILIGFVHNGITALILMFLIGIGSNAVMTPENMLLQSIIDDDKRGRIMSLNSLCFMGTTSISSFFAGSIAHIAGISNTFVILGSLMIITACILSYKLSKLKFN